MAKSGMDDEALTMQRCARELEKLDDEQAAGRVALYLYLRYTAAGDAIAPGGSAAIVPAAAPTAPAPTPPRGAHVPAHGPAAPRRADRPTVPATAPTGPDDGPDDGPDGAGDGRGWNLNGGGIEEDDDLESIEPLSDEPEPETIDVSEIPGAGDEVEVEI